MKLGVGNVFLKISPKLIAGCLIALASVGFCLAQGDIAVGSWRFHLSYKNIRQLTGSEETVFALGENSLFYFSIAEPVPKTLSKKDGLYGHDFASIAFDPISKTLLVTYSDGTIDLVTEPRIRRINDIRTNSLITRKTIHSIRIIDGSAWLCADFGIAQINLANGYIESAYQNLGLGGSSLAIKDVAIFDNKIYAVTDSGVIRAELSANLNDFNQWEPLNLGNTNPFSQAVAGNDGIYFLGQDQQVYFWQSGSLDWIIGTMGVKDLKVSEERIYFSMNYALYAIDQLGNLEIIYSQESNVFSDFHITQKGVLLATPDNGVSIPRENKTIYVQGPPRSQVNFAQINGLTVAYPREPVSPLELSSQHHLGVFSAGNWDSWGFPSNVSAIAYAQGITSIGTQNGLFRKEGETITPVAHPSLTGGVEIGALTASLDGKIHIGINSPTPRLLITENLNQFSSYEIAGIQTFDKIQVDRLGNCWILDGQAEGGRLHLFNPESGLSRSFGSQINNGALPGQYVRDFFLDSEQNLWIATNRGIAYFFNASEIVASTAVNAVLPLFENQIALANTPTNQILIAPDRSIWIGTANQGLWHFAPDFEKLIRNFTVQNSPIPALQIRSLSLNDNTGELFISTAAGSLSYRAESIQPSNDLGSLKIYPNPIRQDFNGVVSIEGLTDFSTLKIATTAGRVVASFAVGGGKITWNLMSSTGKRIAPGVYLVYVIDEAGLERTAGKFLVH